MTFDADPFHGWDINGFLGPGIGRQAISQQFFTTPGAYSFVDAKVALRHFSGPARLHVILQEDASGLPGPVVEDIPVDLIGDAPAIYAAISTLSPILRDSLYWLTVAARDTGVVAGWNWNSIGDASSTNFAGTQGGPDGPWGLGFHATRSAFQIEGRLVPLHGAVVHQASGGGTVLWGTDQVTFGGTLPWTDTKVTYGITAQQLADGSVNGQMLAHGHDGSVQFKGTVTCLNVVGNRAFLTGDLTQAPSGLGDFPRFAIALEDNGEGSNATAPDRISTLVLLTPDKPRCYAVEIPVTDWTNGNAQVR
jgi:hypothetical protein